MLTNVRRRKYPTKKSDGFSRKSGVTKKYKKKATTTRSKITANIGAGLPKKMIMTHKYTDYYNISSSTGLLQTELFRCNSLYDPSFSHTGHQPMYFDQLSALYDHYTVIGSKITWKICQNNTGLQTAKAAIYINDDSTVTPTAESLSEQTTSRVLILPAYSNNIHTVVQKWSAKKAFGKAILGNLSFQGTSSSNPTEEQYFTLAAYGVNPSVPMSLDVFVTIEYITVWTELKDIIGS